MLPARGLYTSVALIVCLLSRTKYAKQYTRWNIVLLFLHRSMGIPVQSIFINSVTTMISFQLGATDGAKRRLMDRAGIVRPSVFLAADCLGHVLPVLVTGSLMCTGGRKRIRLPHVLSVYTWIGLYYLLVGKGFNCEKQYVVYPWRRQLLSSTIAPLVIWAVWNRDMRQNSWIASILATLSTFYIREWYDLLDVHTTKEKRSK